jgi:phosphoribosyl 1,2-cyclic phosphodiesterase
VVSNSPSIELVVSSLGSGSNGNAFLIEYADQRVLVDAGVPIRTLTSCLRLRGIEPAQLTAALISHEHSDHVKALPSLLGRAVFPVFATKGTHAAVPNVPNRMRNIIRAEDEFSIGDLKITPIPVTHDAREPVGFYIEADGVSLAIMSDLGEVRDINAEYASRANHLIIESNYDEAMLRTGPYPAYLKKRIRSSDGHLSNDECAELLRDVVGTRTGGIWLCHLSENNNRPDLALETSNRLLKAAGAIREVTALPRYDGSIVTWRSTDQRDIVQQSALPF